MNSDRESRGGRVERVTSIILAGAAVAVAVTYVSAELNAGRLAGGGTGLAVDLPVVESSAYVGGWEERVRETVRFGPSEAALTVVEFMDFQCPFCRAHAIRMDSLKAEFPEDVAVVVQHYPLRPPPSPAYAASMAVECAGRQGVLEEMYTLLLDQQERIETTPMSEFAEEVGVPDLAEFDRCSMLPETQAVVDADRRWGSELQIRGTPSVMVNGWLLDRPPILEELRLMVSAAREGADPIRVFDGS
jgi:hypothetical protein